MALRKLDPLRIGVIIGPQGLKGDKGDPGVPVPPLPPIQGPPGRDGIDGLNGVTEVVTRIVVDQEALQPVKAAMDALLEDFKKLKKRKPEFLPTGSFQGNSPIQFKDEGINLGPSGDVDALNFTGTGVTATRVGNTITVDVAAGGGGGFTAEDAQDAVGGILVDTSTIDFNYNDVGNQITADTVPAGILAQLLTVDGPGSGLDADTLDGFDSSAFASAGSIPIGANPTALVGLTPINGVATTFLRSDGAPALDQGIAPTWTGAHTFTLSRSNANAAILLAAATTAIRFSETDQGTDGKIWETAVNAAAYSIQALTDAGASPHNALVISRTAASTTIASLALGNATDNPTYQFLGTGLTTHNGKVLITGPTDDMLGLTSALPQLQWSETDGAADGKNWRAGVSSGSWRLDLYTDAPLIGTAALAFTRTGAALTAMNFGNVTNNPTFSFLGTGLTTHGGGILVRNTTALFGNRGVEVMGAGVNSYLSAEQFSNIATGPTLEFFHSRNPTVGSHTIVQNSDVLGVTHYYGSDGVNARSAGSIHVDVDGVPGVDNMPGRITFATNAGGISPTNRWHILSGGNLKTNNDNTELQLGLGTGGAGVGDLRLFHDGTNSIIRNDTGELRLFAGATQAVSIDTTGTQIGIGNGAAATALFINGSVAARDVAWLTAGVARWQARANSTAESGANAGTDWELRRRSDAGADLGAAITIIRATGAVTIPGTLTAGSFVVTEKYSSSMLLGGM